MRQRLVRFWPAAVLILWGLTPLLWFRGTLVSTEDLRFPQDLTAWSRTFWLWNPFIGAGVEALFDTSLIVFQAIPALWRTVSGSLLAAQQVSFVFWFMLAGFGMFRLASRLIPGPRVAWLVAVSFYLFNPWLDHVWGSFKPPLVSGYAVVPIVLSIIIDGAEGRQRIPVALAWLSLLCIVGSAIGNNISETLAVLCPVALLMVTLMVQAVFRGDRQRMVHCGRFCCLVGIVALLSSAFWMLPQVAALVYHLRSGAATVYEQTSRQWLQGISQSTSFFNVLRFQGDWVWYDGFAGEPYRTYASLYATHPLLRLLSWGIPAIVCLGLLQGRGRYRLFVTLLIGCGLVLGMGLHPPVGVVYGWLVEHLPFFWIVRSPYFKFMFMTCLGYALAMGLACAWCCERVQRWRVPPRVTHGLVASFIIAVNGFYASPFVLGKMYALPRERVRLPPNHLVIPSYVTEAAVWLNHQSGFLRIYHLPAKSTWWSRWGYAGASPILAQFSHHPDLFNYRPSNILTAQGAANEAAELLQEISTGLYEGQTHQLAQLLRLMNVRYCVHETDLVYDFYQGPGHITYDAPPFIRAALAPQQGITRGPTFGPWEVYEVSDPLPHAYALPTATLVAGDLRTFVPLTATDLLTTPAVVLTSQISPAMLQALIAAHAFDSVVVTPNVPLPANWPTTLPVTFIVTTTQLTRILDPTLAKPVSWIQGFGPSERGLTGTMWSPLESNNAPNGHWTNVAADPTAWRLEGTVMSPAHARDLYAYLDGTLLAIQHILADQPTMVALNLTLSQGTHTLAWYSPDARTPRPDGHAVGFFFANDWRYGPPSDTGTLSISRAGPYRVRCTTKGPPPSLQFGSTSVTWTEVPGTPTNSMATVTLPVGSCRLTLHDAGETPATLILTPSGQPPLVPRPLTPLPGPAGAAPTQGPVARLPGQGWLIFSEAYHPDWTLTGAPATHVRINGFANGYYLAQPPAGPVTVTFTPQRWVWVGGAISLSTMMMLILLSRPWRHSTPHAE